MYSVDKQMYTDLNIVGLNVDEKKVTSNEANGDPNAESEKAQYSTEKPHFNSSFGIQKNALNPQIIDSPAPSSDSQIDQLKYSTNPNFKIPSFVLDFNDRNNIEWIGIKSQNRKATIRGNTIVFLFYRRWKYDE